MRVRLFSLFGMMNAGVTGHLTTDLLGKVLKITSNANTLVYLHVCQGLAVIVRPEATRVATSQGTEKKGALLFGKEFLFGELPVIYCFRLARGRTTITPTGHRTTRVVGCGTRLGVPHDGFFRGD